MRSIPNMPFGTSATRLPSGSIIGCGVGDAIARDQQLAIAGRRIVGQRLIDLVDLQDRAAEVVTVLLVAAADRLGVVERQPDLVLPERQRRRRVVGGKADVDAGFREFHRGFQSDKRRG